MRDLEQGQWLYWATAVPVTVGVILVGLWWMGEFGNAALWLLNLRRNSGGGNTNRAGGTAVTPELSYGKGSRVEVVRAGGYYGSGDEDDMDVVVRRPRGGRVHYV